MVRPLNGKLVNNRMRLMKNTLLMTVQFQLTSEGMTKFFHLPCYLSDQTLLGDVDCI